MGGFFSNPVVTTVVLPLLAGLLLGAILWLSRSAGDDWRINILAWGAVLLFVYWLLEGVPPLPAIAAKQKLGYLIIFGVLVGAGLSSVHPGRMAGRLLSWLAFVLALVWLGWSRISSGEGMGVVAMALVVTLPLALGSQALASLPASPGPAESPFLVPAALLTTAAAGSIVALTGLFLGMGQLLGGFAALLGGALLVSYAAQLVAGSGLHLLHNASAFAAAYAITCAIILTALLGPVPNRLALLVLSLGPSMALVVARAGGGVLPQAPYLRPILAGAIIAIPAVIASLIAVLDGTSPAG